jgi:LCP family protein required for cell wall assembly
MTGHWGYALRPFTGLIPGFVQLRDGRVRHGVVLLSLAASLTAAAIVTAFRPLRLLTSPPRLSVFLVAVAALSVVMVVSSATSWPSPRPRPLRWAAQLVAPVLALLPLAVAAWVLVPQFAVSRVTFVAAPVAVPSGEVVSPGSGQGGLTPRDPLGSSAVVMRPGTAVTDGARVNVLLLGGDAGPGRWSLRTDSMNLVSFDPATGDAAIIGLPRNLVGAPMPPGRLQERFPRGFPNLLNAVYTFGAANPALVVEALGPTEEPGASLLTASVSELLGVRIDAFILVDMQGFIEVVDARGGVDIFVPRDLPAPGNVPGGKHPVRDMMQGWQRMDGTDALSFVRSRTADSDYQRMGRQRCALASLAAQADPLELALQWPALAAVLAERVRTNITPELLDVLIGAIGTDPSSARSLALVPPRFPAADWSPGDVRAAVAKVIGLPDSSPGATTSPESAEVSGEEMPSEASTAETLIEATPGTTAPVPVSTVAEQCRVRR